ncbi:UNVERIFIED_CONTAM: hypothetical protein Sangu_1978600 [Sesamum angustifolium]|uniref:S-protein homolog n=1 Tax=Sesamum angustifolium TaxID=2727405 RepID=A0AAW2LXW8_9LAMI
MRDFPSVLGRMEFKLLMLLVRVLVIVWSKSLMGQCLSVEIDDASHQCIFKVDVKPSLFSKRKGSKCLEVNSGRIEVFWDLSMAKFGSRPEPLEGYYIGVVLFVSKREHICGKRVFGTKAQFCDNGQIHDLKIECDTIFGDDPFLVVRVDSKPVMQVKHLRWKFRGNCTILVDGIPVEVFWDVHNWLFGSNTGSAVFMFHTSLSTEKLWTGNSISDSSSVFSWICSGSFKESKQPGLGFSLFLYAWKYE